MQPKIEMGLTARHEQGCFSFQREEDEMVLRWLPDLPKLLEAHPHWWWLFTVAVIVIAYVHSHTAKIDWTDRGLMVLFALGGLFIFVVIAITDLKVTFELLIAMTAVFGSGVYTLLYDVLLRFGLAARFTRKRGEKWIKEMDYPYLILGWAGLMLSINKLDVVSDKIARLDTLGPVIVSIAIAVRLLKTRADIEEWNKPGISSEQKTPMSP